MGRVAKSTPEQQAVLNAMDRLAEARRELDVREDRLVLLGRERGVPASRMAEALCMSRDTLVNRETARARIRTDSERDGVQT